LKTDYSVILDVRTSAHHSPAGMTGENRLVVLLVSSETGNRPNSEADALSSAGA
jgi:hypothetical protein